MTRSKDKVTVKLINTVKLVVVNAAVSLSPVARNKDKVTVKLINTVKLVVVNAVSLSPVSQSLLLTQRCLWALWHATKTRSQSSWSTQSSWLLLTQRCLWALWHATKTRSQSSWSTQSSWLLLTQRCLWALWHATKTRSQSSWSTQSSWLLLDGVFEPCHAVTAGCCSTTPLFGILRCKRVKVKCKAQSKTCCY